MIKPFRARWIVLCVGVGVSGSFVSGWADAVLAQREAARPQTVVGMFCSFGPSPPADPGLVAEAPPGWPTEGWATLRRTPRSDEHASLIFEPAGGGLCILAIRRERHGWPWTGVQSVTLDAAYSVPTGMRDPDEERVAGVVDSLGLERSTWAPFEPEGARDVAGYLAAKDAQPFWRRGLRVANPDGPPKNHLLPIDPVWPGFAYNALAFGGGAWALLAAPSLVGLVFGTKRRRRRRGLCVACGYDMRGLDACPECGRAIEGRQGPA